MSGRFRSCQEVVVEIVTARSLAPALGLLAALVPGAAFAQINIDEGKTPAHIFSSDCSVCHKSTRGLANGRGGAALTAYLTEHYTSSRDEAAALAAYVLAGGGGDTVPRRDKPDRDHHTARAEEPKPTTERRDRRTEKPGHDQREPVVAEHSPIDNPGPAAPPSRTTTNRHDKQTPTASRTRPKRRDADTPQPGPATASAAPNAPVTPNHDTDGPAGTKPAPTAPATAANTPTHTAPAANAAAPVDNIPD